MKLFFTTLLLLISSFSLLAQSTSKVTWKYSSKKNAQGQHEVHLTATIQEGWHLYSQTQSSGAIALPTSITITKNPLVTLVGKTTEKGTVYDQYDKATASRSRFYKGTVDFVQVVQVKGSVSTSVSGEVEFMVCSDDKCLPPEKVKFSVKL